MASSSLSSSCKYEVFLSFRGKDTREAFTSHLFKELSERKKIKTFIDEDLERGDEISPALLNAIEGSMISIIILSKDYASSKWCLDELVKILQCRKMNGQIVIPVFYYVHPSEVRNQTGCFAEPFRKHEKNFRKMPAATKVQNWREALKEVSYLSGYESEKIRPDSKLVDVIVKDILKKLEDKISVSTDFDGLVGINSRIERVKSLLCIGLQDIRIVGIWGMGGIGKTTLAEAIFKQVSRDFEGKCFMENVRGKLEKGGELKYLQTELFSHLLDEKLEKVYPNLPQHILERLRRTKVFIVLDDVNELNQLQLLVGKHDRFGQGSRIIVTTRDKQILDQYDKVNLVHKVEELNYHEAHEHFNNFAFGQRNCPEDLMELSNSVVDYANGNPLALKVLGSFFRSKNKPEWEIGLNNLNRISDRSIFNILKISYNELHLDVKDIFLDIACFFKGDDKDHVISISGDRALMIYGLDVLYKKSLINISHNELEMHDLLQEMGREIVRQESQELGKRSRLWHPDDVCQVLKKNKGTDSIKGIFLNLSKIREISLNSRVFTSMTNLRLLKFHMPWQFGQSYMSLKVHLPEGLEYLSDELRYLYWHGYPLTMLPRNFSPDNLIELSLPYSKVQLLWEEKKEAFMLEFIDLQHSQDLTRIPDPSEIPNVKRINLSNCIKLARVPSIIHHFNHLRFLRFRGCTSLRDFPSNTHFTCAIEIDFSNCTNLTVFPQISGNIQDLDLCNTAIDGVPSSIESLTSLENLTLRDCERLTYLPPSICKLKSLRWLDLYGCSNFEIFPEILEQMESLEYICLSYTKIKQLPSSIQLMTGLTDLRLSECRELDSLPMNLGDLKSLKFIYGANSTISRLPSSIAHLNKLEIVRFNLCKGLVLPPLSGLTNLREVFLRDCDIIEIPEDIGCLSSLKKLDLTGNNFENIPTSIKKLSQLKYLYLDRCNMLRALPELPLRLRNLKASNCLQLESLPELPECLEKLDASLLETRFLDSEALNRSMRYRFDYSPKLKEKANNILADSQLRFQHMAVAVLKIFHFYGKKPDGMSVYLPRSGDIPEWFSNQRSGSSITIQLPQYSCNRNFIGFALCAVFGFEEDSHASRRLFYVTYRYNFGTKTPSTSEHFVGTDFRGCTSTFVESDKVFLKFDPCWTVRLPDGNQHVIVSIDFSVDGSTLPPNVKCPKVKCCGVCPVYAHLNESPPNTFTVNMVPPTEEEYTQIMKLNKDSTTIEEEVQPSPTTIPEENIGAPYQKGSLFSRVFQRRRVCLFVFLIFAILLCLRRYRKLTFDW